MRKVTGSKNTASQNANAHQLPPRPSHKKTKSHSARKSKSHKRRGGARGGGGSHARGSHARGGEDFKDDRLRNTVLVEEDGDDDVGVFRSSSVLASGVGGANEGGWADAEAAANAVAAVVAVADVADVADGADVAAVAGAGSWRRADSSTPTGPTDLHQTVAAKSGSGTVESATSATKKNRGGTGAKERRRARRLVEGKTGGAKEIERKVQKAQTPQRAIVALSEPMSSLAASMAGFAGAVATCKDTSRGGGENEDGDSIPQELLCPISKQVRKRTRPNERMSEWKNERNERNERNNVLE